MGFLASLLAAPRAWARPAARSAARPAETLYRALVAEARRPEWYLHGAVPDTIDGRFDMVALVVALAMLRLEQTPDDAALNAALAERFIEDMDGSLRQMGIGDQNVGKEIGRMMSALGGRLGAYREAATAGSAAAWEAALTRNLWRGDGPAEPARQWLVHGVMALAAAMAAAPPGRLAAGEWRDSR